MRRVKYTCNGCEGRLPPVAPLATPYVPYQLENPPEYDGQTALIRGTLFPGLEFPFMGMVTQEKKALTPKTELQTMAFAIQELALYLDTHRDDRKALALYRTYQQMYHKCMMEYSRKFGPLNHCTPGDGPYDWLNDPWPWEYCANKEA